jgi:hypothetical protein
MRLDLSPSLISVTVALQDHSSRIGQCPRLPGSIAVFRKETDRNRALSFGSANRCNCVEHLFEMRDAQRRVQQFSAAIEAVGFVFGGVR